MFKIFKKKQLCKEKINGYFATPEAIWANCIYEEIEKISAIERDEKSGYVCSFLIDVKKGSVGVYLEYKGSQITSEVFLHQGTNTQEKFFFDEIKDTKFVVRNVSEKGCSEFNLECFEVLPSYELDISKEIVEMLPYLLISENSLDLDIVANKFKLKTCQIKKLICDKSIDLDIDLKKIYSDSLGRLILKEYYRMLELTDLCSTEDLGSKQLGASLTRDYWKLYLKQCTIRVYQLIKEFNERGFNKGSILEIGCFIGTFAIPLSKMGYEVTVVDRFDFFKDTIDVFKNEMIKNGVTLVTTNEENEYEVIKNLPQFDAVISMAVIEHIPHTPRYFLEALIAKVKQGGLIALDTPNIARYWNRKYLNEGKTIHQGIENQFWSKIPYLGHHREYTVSELVWMLRQLKVTDIKSKLFDYNLLQFSKIEHDHRDSFLSMICDPELKDTVLVIGNI
jgi:2-polyprenyl-3-methyl-5-hydroxy-6-metoxy-1,4-benzoquinol methylase